MTGVRREPGSPPCGNRALGRRNPGWHAAGRAIRSSRAQRAASSAQQFDGATMIDLHYWTTPNGHKITIFLEEAGLPYRIFPVNIGKGQQFARDFLAISPNNRIPAIVDRDPADGGKPVEMFESGAILLYLAEKTGRFIAGDLRGRADTIQWVFWQMGNLGPMAGQNNHFSNYAVDKIPYAMDRYRNEVNRLYGVLNRRLADRSFIAGDYSIADMASYPWVVPYERQGQKLEDFPHLKRWFEFVRARPAVARAYAKAKEINPNPPGIRTAEERAILFGQTAASVANAVR
jgi:GSH-dependent disulfide-bond oxidoreductase